MNLKFILNKRLKVSYVRIVVGNILFLTKKRKQKKTKETKFFSDIGFINIITKMQN